MLKLAIRGRYMRPRRFYIDGELLLRYEQLSDGDYIVLKVEGQYEAGQHLLRMENDDGQYAEAYFTLEGLGIGRPTPLETGHT